MKLFRIVFAMFFFIFYLNLNCKCQISNVEQSVLIVLKQQEKEWNLGNIRNYMKGYWNNDSLTFIGKNGIQKGWEQTLNNYIKSYPDKSCMGKLTFDHLLVEVLCNETAYVYGRWFIEREKGNIGGYFTLIFRKINGEFVIVCDHSS
jgi:hypothetical protein